MKKRYFAIPILAIALHFLLSNLLYFLVERLVLDVFHIPSQQFMKHSYWGEILIYAVLILVFFTLYNLLWRKDISEPRTATNFKDVLGSLVVGFGICGISGLWIMLAEQLPSLQKSVEAVNAGAENIAGGNAFGTFMIAVIAAPVVEEILFRGIVLRSMRKFAPAWAAILISSVLFGVYHLNIVQAAYATLMGIAAGILYEKKRNLLFPILVHFANNLITMLQGFAPSEVNELISIFILIMIAPAGYVVCRSLRQGKRACKVFIQCIKHTAAQRVCSVPLFFIFVIDSAWKKDPGHSKQRQSRGNPSYLPRYFHRNLVQLHGAGQGSGYTRLK